MTGEMKIFHICHRCFWCRFSSRADLSLVTLGSKITDFRKNIFGWLVLHFSQNLHILIKKSRF